MTKENDLVKTRRNEDEIFLELRRHWKELPSSFKKRVVEETYSKCHSLRKTAKTLGIGKTTAYFYIKQKETPESFTASVNGIAVGVLEATLPLLIQQIHDEKMKPPKPAGDDENITKLGGEENE